MANGLLMTSPAQVNTHSHGKKRSYFPMILWGSLLLLVVVFVLARRTWLVTAPVHTLDCRNATKIFSLQEAEQAPEQVCQLLVASDSDFVAFTDLIPRLSNIRVLTIKHVTFTHIPSQIAQLRTLLDLRIFNTEETFLPTEIGQLTELESLSINHTDLFYLPAEIGQLKKLRHLSISASPELMTLPVTLSNLTALEGVTLRALPYLTFPKGFTLSNHLTALELSANNLSTVPDFVYDLSNLTSLVLTDNAIATLSPRLFQLTKLQTLRINDNRLHKLPSLQAFRQLRSLDISHNQIQTLPSGVDKLENLHYLGIAGNAVHQSEVSQLKKNLPTLIIN